MLTFYVLKQLIFFLRASVFRVTLERQHGPLHFIFPGILNYTSDSCLPPPPHPHPEARFLFLSRGSGVKMEGTFKTRPEEM